MAVITNAPLWFQFGIGMAALLLAGLAYTAWRLDAPSLSIKLSYLTVFLAGALTDLHNGAHF